MRRSTMKDDARRQGKGFHPGSRMGGQNRLFLGVGIMLLALGVLSVVSVSITQADDQPLPSMTINYQNGTITAINEKTLDINGRTYGMVPDVVMLDDFGRVLDASRLVVSAEVKFHVQKEHSNMIEKMIVTLPR
jgi:basic membrane lipoprotein Med (substrate-binding protein (PBP1-ABC) superfamily)